MNASTTSGAFILDTDNNHVPSKHHRQENIPPFSNGLVSTREKNVRERLMTNDQNNPEVWLRRSSLYPQLVSFENPEPRSTALRSGYLACKVSLTPQYHSARGPYYRTFVQWRYQEGRMNALLGTRRRPDYRHPSRSTSLVSSS